ncbi:MAG: citrate/2-methylcitrate synthase [Eubacteriales bacterium]|nr:citrate/2-methylcitrate synthase [Eubacteriales bacterium]
MKKIESKKLDAAISEYAQMAIQSSTINPELYLKYEVKRGLRDISGKGVLAGLTEISEVSSYIIEESDLVPCEGKLYYRGYDIEDIVAGFLSENRYGFEETCYLLLFGKLPNEEEYREFCEVLSSVRALPNDFVHSAILSVPSPDVMNSIARSVLTLYSYDKKADDTSVENVLRQSIQLIAQLPLLAVYGYQGVSHYHNRNSLIIHTPDPNLSTAENILRMLRVDMKYSPLEAQILDLALVLHADHGGGNNSSFTTHVVTSSGTDTYSSVVASLGSLKGPRHGGANIKVVQMFEDIKQNVKDWGSDEEVEAYIKKILNKEAFDRSGLVYGIGHAVYSLSDPRAVIFKQYVEKLAKEKGLEEEYLLYKKVEEIAPEVIAKTRRMYKGVSANVDFYSGFVYRMLNLPQELFTPLFAVARIAGWSAHRLEEIINAGKIIRPAYKSVAKRQEYVSMKDR